MSELTVTKETFYSELLNRFFNPNSYFFKCLDRELEAVMAEARSAGENKYLLLGNLVDRLVAADDTASEISALTEIEGFKEFTEKLRQGANFLYESDLDAERMKAEIDGLAHSLFNSFLLAMQDPRSVEALGTLLGARAAHNSTDGDIEIEELPSEELPKAQPDPEPELQIMEESQPRAEARTLLTEIDGGTDAASNVEVTCGSDDEGSSAISSEAVSRKREVGYEPASLVTVFRKDMDQQLSRLRKISTDWKNQPGKQHFWNDCERLLGSIALSCVVYGFEAFEQVAAKSRKALQKLSATPDSNQARAVEILDETARVLADFLVGAPEKVEAAEVVAFTRWVQSPEKRPQPKAPEAPAKESRADVGEVPPAKIEEASNAIPEDLSPDFDVFKPEDVTLPGEGDEEILSLIAEITRENGRDVDLDAEAAFDSPDDVPVASALLAANLAVTLPASEPGDASDANQALEKSLRKINESASVEEIASASETDDSALQIEEVQPAEAPASIDFGAAEAGQIELARAEAMNAEEHARPMMDESGGTPAAETEAVSPQPARPAEPVAEAAAVHVVENTPVALYKQQAGLYFGVIEEALATLRTHRMNMSALEDLELASNALYGLTLKLNLDEFGVFPDLVLTLIKNTLAARYTLSDAEHELLLNAFAYFQRLRNTDDLKADAYQGVIASLRDLNGRIREHARTGSILRDEREPAAALR